MYEVNKHRHEEFVKRKAKKKKKMETGLNFEKLTADNYPIWRHRMKALLVTKGIEKAVIEKEHESSEQALALMCLCVTNDYVDMIAQSENAHSAWAALEEIHAGQTAARRLSLRKELTNLSKSPTESMIGYIMRAKHICSSLKTIDGSVTNTQLIDAILAGLPNEYSNKVDMLATIEETDMLKIQNQLLQAESMVSAKETSKGQVAFVAQTRKPKLNCSYCGRTGHTRERCWYLNGLPKHLQKEPKQEQDDKTFAFVTHALTCGSATTLENVWIIDSGATTHVCSNYNLLKNGTNQTDPQQILVGNGQVVSATEYGFASIQPELEIRNVLFCPELKVNLLSVNKLIEDGYDVYFTNDECSIWKGKQKIICTQKRNNLYLVEPKMELLFSTMELHRKLAHFGDMTKLKGTVDGVNEKDLKKIDNCDICIQAKQTRNMIERRKGEHAAEVGELLHIDLMGPITPLGRNGERYIITILDEKSKLGFSKALQHKSDAACVIKAVIKILERQTERTVKIVRSDRGTEFLNKDLQYFLQDSGILQQTSAPYTPEQNGNAERFNRTLIEKVRAVLLESKLEKSFWPHAVEFCSYVRNRVPCKPHCKTPMEVAFGQKPNVSQMHIFGEECFVLKTAAEKSGKLDAKSKRGIFLGYEAGTKDTYKVMCDNKLILSRNVRFTGLPKEKLQTELPENVQPEDLSYATGCDDVHPPTCEDALGCGDTEATNNTVAGEPTQLESTEISETHDRRYPTRERKKPQNYWLANVCLAEPQSLRDALSGPQKEDWMLALHDEISSLQKHNVFDVVDRQPGIKSLPCKWVFKIKYDQHGNVQRFKARLVAKGFKQVTGIDFNETFAPVARQSTLRLLLTIAAVKNWEIQNVDIKTAFLNGDLEEDIYMDIPPGFDVPGKVWKLRKTLYGLKQAPRAWHLKLTDKLENMGFVCSTADPGLYCAGDFLLMVYVDDLLLCGDGKESVERIKTLLLEEFEGRDLGATEHFLGIKIQRDRQNGTVFLSQENYVENVLQRFRMDTCHSVSTPLDLGTKWNVPTDTAEVNFPYQELVGCLMYLAVSTRPDIAYVTNCLARYVSAPTTTHIAIAKRVLKYLQGSKSLGLLLGSHNQNLLEGYCDANYGSCEVTRRSTTGYLFTFSGSLISWQTKLQKTVATSTTEAEYMAAAAAAKEALYLRKILLDVGFGAKCITIHCDNQGAVNLTKNALTVSRTKHVDIAHHFVRNRVSRGELQIQYIHSSDQLADFLTKALGPTKLQTAIQKLALIQDQATSRGEC